jgi:hypothetical protein
MKQALEIGGGVGAVFGLYVGILFGHARARAIRAWRDFKAARDQVKRFIRETLHQWRLVAQISVVSAAVTAVVVIVMVSR